MDTGGSGGYCLPPSPSGRLRWAVNTSAWDPQRANHQSVEFAEQHFKSASLREIAEELGSEFAFLLSLLSDVEQHAVVRYKRIEDKKRALISRLLQHAAVGVCCNVLMHKSEIWRTKGGKPFLAPRLERGLSSSTPLPRFNFNVSHEGDFCVLASEPLHVVGVDVAAPAQMRGGRQPRGGGGGGGGGGNGDGSMRLADLQRSFNRTCTASEWSRIERWRGGGEGGEEGAFRRTWSCKEAFVKARGDGLAFELKRVEFDIQKYNKSTQGRGGDEGGRGRLQGNGAEKRRGGGAWLVKTFVDGEEKKDVNMDIYPLGKGHYVSVCRLPPSYIVDADGVFQKIMMNEEEEEEEKKKQKEKEMEEQPSSFELINVSALVPENRLEDYEKSGGDVL